MKIEIDDCWKKDMDYIIELTRELNKLQGIKGRVSYTSIMDTHMTIFRDSEQENLEQQIEDEKN